MTGSSGPKGFMDSEGDCVIEDSCQGAYDQGVARYRAERVGSKQDAELTARIRVIRHPGGTRGEAYFTTLKNYDYPLKGRGSDFFETISGGLLTLEKTGEQETTVHFPKKPKNDEDTRFNPNWSKSETYLGGEFYKMGNCKSATVGRFVPVFKPASPSSLQGSTIVTLNFNKQLGEDNTESSNLGKSGDEWDLIPQESVVPKKHTLSRTTESQRCDAGWTLVDNESEAGEEIGLVFDDEALIDDCTLREATSSVRQNS